MAGAAHTRTFSRKRLLTVLVEGIKPHGCAEMGSISNKLLLPLSLERAFPPNSASVGSLEMKPLCRQVVHSPTRPTAPHGHVLQQRHRNRHGYSFFKIVAAVKIRSKPRCRQPSNSVALAAHVTAAPETQRNPTPAIQKGGTILAAQTSTKPGLSADQGPRPRPRLLRLGLRALEGPTGNTKHGVTLLMRVPPYSARVALCVCLVCLSVCPVMPPPYPSCQVQTRTSSLGRGPKKCTWCWP